MPSAFGLGMVAHASVRPRPPVYVRPLVNGRAERAFSIVTLPPPRSGLETREAVRAHTRACYASSQDELDRRAMAATDRGEDIEDDQEIVYFEE